MFVEYDQKFLKQAAKLPKRHQNILADQISRLTTNPFDVRLHTKQLSTPLEGIFSFRVTREYRVLFRFIDVDRVFLFSVKHRKDIYR